MSLIRPLLTAALLATAAQAQAVTYDFDSGDQGWFSTLGGAQTWKASGGNAAGYLEIADVSGDDFRLNAPVAALGNWSSLLNGTFAFDAKNISGVAADWPTFGTVTITGSAGIVSFDMVAGAAPEPDGLWHRYSVVLNTANFGALLPAVLGNVTAFSLTVESHNGFGTGAEINGIDNVTLAAAVPEPASGVLLGLGLAAIAWRRRRAA